MTLIVAAIHKHAAFMTTDTRLSVAANHQVVDDDAIKNFCLKSADGHVLIGFTGRAYIDDMLVTNWLLDKLTAIDASNKTYAQVIGLLKSELESNFSNYYPGKVPDLTLVVCGWELGESKRPRIYIITNCENVDGSPKVPTNSFESYCIPADLNGSALVARGAMSATKGSDFRRHTKQTLKLLAQASNQLDALIRDQTIKLVLAAAADPHGWSVSSNVKASMLNRKSGQVDFRGYPTASTYSLPGFSNGNLTVSGLKVHNDPIQGGTTKIG